MSAARHIAAAEAALRTGQPNLAALYMRRAAELVAAERTEYARGIRAARHAMNNDLTNALQDLVDCTRLALGPIIEAMQAFGRDVAGIARDCQAAYTLAGPSKGGAA